MGLRRLFKNHLYKKKFNISETEMAEIKNKNIIITGANSGIGLALTEKFIELDNKVFATYNKTNDNLLKLKSNNLKICQCDQSQLDNIEKLKDHVIGFFYINFYLFF